MCFGNKLKYLLYIISVLFDSEGEPLLRVLLLRCRHTESLSCLIPMANVFFVFSTFVVSLYRVLFDPDGKHLICVFYFWGVAIQNLCRVWPEDKLLFRVLHFRCRHTEFLSYWNPDRKHLLCVFFFLGVAVQNLCVVWTWAQTFFVFYFWGVARQNLCLVWTWVQTSLRMLLLRCRHTESLSCLNLSANFSSCSPFEM